MIIDYGSSEVLTSRVEGYKQIIYFTKKKHKPYRTGIAQPQGYNAFQTPTILALWSLFPEVCERKSRCFQGEKGKTL